MNLISWSPYKVWIICSWALCVCVSSVRGKEWNERSNPFLRFVFLSEEKLTVHLSKGWKQESELVNKAEKLAFFLRVIANPKVVEGCLIPLLFSSIQFYCVSSSWCTVEALLSTPNVMAPTLNQPSSRLGSCFWNNIPKDLANSTRAKQFGL